MGKLLETKCYSHADSLPDCYKEAFLLIRIKIRPYYPRFIDNNFYSTEEADFTVYSEFTSKIKSIDALKKLIAVEAMQTHLTQQAVTNKYLTLFKEMHKEVKYLDTTFQRILEYSSNYEKELLTLF